MTLRRKLLLGAATIGMWCGTAHAVLSPETFIDTDISAAHVVINNVPYPVTSLFNQVIQGNTYGIKCDGVTDDTNALNGLMTAIVARGPNTLGMLPSGKCIFSSTLNWNNLPTHSGIMGAGLSSTWLYYTGASTTNDLISIQNSAVGLYYETIGGFRIQSQTVMTAGAALHLKGINSSHISDISISNDAGSTLWNGIYIENMQNTLVEAVNSTGNQHDGIAVANSACTGGGPWLVGFRGYTNGNAALHLGGGAGGMTLDDSSLSLNGAVGTEVGSGIIVDNAIYPSCVLDTQVLTMGPNVYLDQNYGPGIVINDPASVNSYIELNGWNENSGNGGGSSGDGATPAIWIKQWSTAGGAAKIIVRNHIIGSAHFGSDCVRVDDVRVTLALNADIVHGCNGWGLNPTVADPNISISPATVFQGSTLGSVNLTGFTPDGSTIWGVPSFYAAALDHFNYGGGVTIRMKRADGTFGTPTAVQSNDVLAELDFDGHNGTAFGIGGYFRCVADQAWSVSAQGTRCVIATVADGSTTASTAVTIAANGGFNLVKGVDVTGTYTAASSISNPPAPGNIPYETNANFTGTWGVGQANENYNFIADTSIGNASSVAPAVWPYYLNLNVGYDGGRNVFLVNANVQAQSASTMHGQQISVGNFWVNATVNDGGTGTGNGQGAGALYAMNPKCTLGASATFYFICEGAEVDIGLATGSNAYHKRGWNIVLLSTDTVQGTGDDAAFEIQAQGGATAGFKYLYTWEGVAGSTGKYIDTANGTVLGNIPAQFNTGGGPQFAAPTSKFGVNFGAWDFVSSGYAFQSAGFQVDPTGAVLIGASKANYTPSSGVFALGASGSCVTVATVDAASSPNTGNFVGDYLYDLTNNGQYKIATIDGSGKALTVSIQRASCTQSGSPPATQAVTGGSGGAQGIILDFTWKAAVGTSLTSGVYSAGTKFTTTGCSVSATTGGAQAGTYTSGTTGTCTVTVTFNGTTGSTAPNGWACDAQDVTTPSDAQAETTTTQTTAVISGPTTSGDVIRFKCIGY